MSRCARLTALPVLAAVTVVGLAAPATAAPADRAGWWTRASAGGVAVPAPTAMPGDLRITSGDPAAPTAYAAVLLTAVGATRGSLDLLVRPGSALGTGEVVACPTADTTWEAGDAQPYDTAPAFDCTDRSFGTLSEDGTTLSFLLDESTQGALGSWSLALVPLPEGTAPFSVDLQAPGDAAFTAEPPASEPPADDEPFDPGTGEGTAVDPIAPGFEAPAGPTGSIPSGTDVTSAPLLAGTAPLSAAAPAPAPAGPAPALAGAAPLAGTPRTVATRPVAQPVPGGERGRLLALLALVALSAGVGYAAGQTRPGPRLIGGRAGAAVVAGAGAGAVAVAGEAAQPGARERGIGRFARQRDAAPRRLR